ncbi:hypothetical protein [Photobacterium leiognathi]|uniref:hypothetical protein n=1 Tax=Photobacterium leiognathi TaxID=553611 RepID=UPI0029828984|nr:hypothetical protein [Photobacterium leiognathi]
MDSFTPKTLPLSVQPPETNRQGSSHNIDSLNITIISHTSSFTIDDLHILEKKSGGNRNVYFDRELGRGYKIPKDIDGKDPSKIRGVMLEFLRRDTEKELRLNDIYEVIYQGKYAYLATFSSVEVDLGEGKVFSAPSFPINRDALPIEKGEKISLSAIQELQKAGYNPTDIKLDNFVKVKNEEGSYDYLPIDAKLIGKDGSSSLRSRFVKRTQEARGHFDMYKGKHIDTAI